MFNINRYKGLFGAMKMKDDFQSLNLFFLAHFTLAILLCLYRGNFLPAAKTLKRIPLILSTLWLPFGGHVFFFTVEMYFKKLPTAIAVHHILACILALITVVFERQWYTSAMFTMPWWLHAASYTVAAHKRTLNAPRNLNTQILIVYNMCLFSVCAGGLFKGHREKWTRFTPMIPIVGLVMLASNLETYCRKMKGKLCIAWYPHDRYYYHHYALLTGFCIFVTVFGLVSFVRSRAQRRLKFKADNDDDDSRSIQV